MKIGQLTFHGSHNYGSVLQAYALSTYLKKLHNEVEIINLRPQTQKDAYKIIKQTDNGIHKIFKCLIYHLLKKRFNNFERFINQVLPISTREFTVTDELKEIEKKYDCFVCGGDQIWNPFCQDFEEAYYLQFISESNIAKRISYAPSLGKTSFDESTLNNIKKWLETFDSISVRETRGAELLQKLTDKEVHTVCDPVFLLNKEEWDQLAHRPKYKKPYILVYFLDNNHGSRGLIDYLHQKLGYDVVLLNEYMRDFIKPYHKAYSASPEEFVGLFMNASFIYTNSFHGTAFATIFQKPFITAIAKDQENALNNNDSRKIDFLKKIGLENRLYTSGCPSKEKLLEINYTMAQKKLSKFIDESKDYLVKALGENNAVF